MKKTFAILVGRGSVKVILSVSLAMPVLVGCMTAPTDVSGRALALSDAGAMPADVPAVVREALRYRLKDFESARIEVPLKPRPVVFARAPGLNAGGAGWEICPMVNAKNGFGGYTGFKPVFILWRNGEIVDFNASDMAEFWCRDKNDARLLSGARLN